MQSLAIADPNVNPRRYSRGWFRALEIIPGVAVWFALLAPFILSYSFPLLVTGSIIVFDVYWLQKSLQTAFSLLFGYTRLRRNLKRDWQHQLDLSVTAIAEGNLDGAIDWRQLYQTVIFTTYREEEAILDASIKSFADAHYPTERKILVLATEGRDAANASALATHLQQKYAASFGEFIVTEHPDGIVGEVKGKGANATWAAKQLVTRMGERGIPLEHVVVTTADADTRFFARYFQCLAYMYSTTPDRVHCSYQPVASFINNIWKASMVSRVLAIQTTFWQMVESTRDYRLITFSTHAMSLQTLKDMDYWCTSVVNEDSRQFYRAYFRYHGNFRAIPLFLPVYMDAVHVSSFRGTLKNLYLQQQRWAYGAEHTPYVILESLRHPEIPPLNRIALVWRQANGHFSWATQAFFITFVGWLPVLLNHAFAQQVVAYNFPEVTKVLLSITWIGIVVSNVISFMMLPPRPKTTMSLLKIPSLFLQWLMVPVTSLFFGAIVSIDAQTRLMLGKYLGFRVTEKTAV
jgi:hypothetical protein